MTARRPSKPWRVILDGADLTVQSDHTSEAKAYTVVRDALGGGEFDTARVEYWEDGLWRWFETMKKEDLT